MTKRNRSNELAKERMRRMHQKKTEGAEILKTVTEKLTRTAAVKVSERRAYKAAKRI